MSNGSTDRPVLRRIASLSWIIVVIVAVIVAGIFYSRWQENKDIEAQAAEKQREQAHEVAESLGGSSFEIMNFYAAPGAIHRGDSAELCYGVSNAKTVDVTPKLPEATWPSFSRCIAISPRKTTTYTLTAIGANGQKKSATLTLEVQ